MQPLLRSSRLFHDEQTAVLDVGAERVKEIRNFAAGILWLLLIREIVRHRFRRR